MWFARGRFVLVAAVVALITVLVGFLSGLAGGLAAQNVSAILHLAADRVVVQQPSDGEASFSTSEISDATIDRWRHAEGVESVTPIGIAPSRAGRDDAEDSTGVTVFSALSTTEVASPFRDVRPLGDAEIALSAGAASSLHAAVGDTVTVAGLELTVAQVGPDIWYSHTPVVVVPPGAWADLSAGTGRTGEPTALAVVGDPDWNGLSTATGTSARTPLMSLRALDSFTSEIGSLGLMIVLLFAISALVVGAFFTVWTMQRAADTAVLRALGATTGSLVRGALGQAAIVLAVGVGIGLCVVVVVGGLLERALPFAVTPLTTIAPAAVLGILGLAGATLALRPITTTDPLTALGSNR
nr:ABC transporter permease [Gordonia humi]